MKTWSNLVEHIEEKYPFLENLQLCNNEKWVLSGLQPLIKVSFALTAGTIFESDKKRLVILFPNKYDVGFWVSLFCVLESMRRDYHRISKENLNFKKGEIIEYRNCILRYEGEVVIDGDLKVCVSCSDLKEYFPASWAGIVPRFQRCETNRPLSPYKKLGRIIKKDKKDYTEDRQDNLDKLLNIRTYGNKTIYQSGIILNSPKGKTINKLNHSYINKTLISEMILWYEINSEGDFLNPKGQLRGNPVLVTSGDLYSTRNYIENNSLKTNGIIIDGSNLNPITDNLQMLDDILSNESPVVAFANTNDGENINYLKERNFLIWQWNRNYIDAIISNEEIQKHTVFHDVLCSLNNYNQRIVKIKKCKCSTLQNIEKITYKLNKTIEEHDVRAERFFSKLIKIFLELSRLIYIPSKTDLEIYNSEIKDIEEDLELHSTFISENILQAFNQYLDDLRIKINDLSEKINTKAELLNAVLGKESDKSILVICANEKALSNITEKLNDIQNSYLKFISYSQYLDDEKANFETVIIPGWFGKHRMQKIFNDWNIKNILLLLYDFEKKWYEIWRQYWEKINSHNMRGEDFSSMFSISSDELSFLNSDVESKDSKAGKRSREYDPELVLKRNRYSGYIYSDSADTQYSQESVEAIPVSFSGGGFAFFKKSHLISDASSFFIQPVQKKPEIRNKLVSELKPGNHIIMRESNKDIIREIADEILKNSGLENVRDEALVWKKDLIECYRKTSNNFEKLLEQLRKKGCERHEVTIRNWLTSDHIIAPESLDDIISIARVCGDANLENNIGNAEKAIKTVRGAHHQAGSYLSGKLLIILPNVLDYGHSSNKGEEIISLELDEYGTVNILRIEEVGEKMLTVNVGSLNRVFYEE